jgi:hypothetical protein
MHYECIKNTFKNENKTVLCMHVEYVLNAFQNGKREHFWCMLHNACYIFFFHLQYIINACRHAKILLGIYSCSDGITAYYIIRVAQI